MFFGIHICMDEVQMFLISLPFIGIAIKATQLYGRRAIALVRSVRS